MVVAYNDSSGDILSPESLCGASVSTNGGASFFRLPEKFNSGGACYGGPSVFYSVSAARWYVTFLSATCGGQGIAEFESTDGTNWTQASCAAVTANGDRPTSWVDNNPSSPFYGRQYVLFNDFSVSAGAIRLTASTDGGFTWSAAHTVFTAPYRRALQIAGSLESNGRIFIQTEDEGGGGLNGARTHFIFSSTDGGASFTAPIQETPAGLGPGRAVCSDSSYSACIYSNGYWRDMGAGQLGVGPNSVLHYVYSARTGDADPGDVYYVRSTDGGSTWVAPVKLNTDATPRAQWGPSLSANVQGRLFVSWYDERNTTDESLQRYGRASLDNGATWADDVALSDVIFAKPLQPDSTAQASDAGTYNHAAFSDDGYGSETYHAWTDGRVILNGQPQQDVFFKKIVFKPITFTVTTTNEHSDGICSAADCSLWDAMNAANATYNSLVNFAPGVTGTITTTLQTGGINVVRPVSIIGPGARSLTINGSGTGRIFNIASTAGNVKISRLTLANGKPPGSSYPAGYGGAILNAAALSLFDCTLNGNVANVHGGAIFLDGQGRNASLSLTRCTMSNNSASLSGGAIFAAAYNGSTVVNLTSTTLDHNHADEYGGAVYSDGTSSGNASLIATNCTFNQNSANLGAGGIYNDALNPSTSGTATVTLANTIFAAGVSGENLVNDNGSFSSLGYNISSDAAGGPSGTAPGGLLNGTNDLRNTNPQLASLANNGGPTDTAALVPSSPAFNSGGDALAPPLDQRGYLRVGQSDRGAFELHGLPLRITSITRVANGHISLQGIGVPNDRHTIQTAARPDAIFDFLANVTANASGTVQYDDAGAVGLTARFYRLTFP